VDNGLRKLLVEFLEDLMRSLRSDSGARAKSRRESDEWCSIADRGIDLDVFSRPLRTESFSQYLPSRFDRNSPGTPHR